WKAMAVIELVTNLGHAALSGIKMSGKLRLQCPFSYQCVICCAAAPADCWSRRITTETAKKYADVSHDCTPCSEAMERST
ncbi:hypothetical protein, partial [Phyllobacterium brassicacearum]